ncbi:4'-phosphopantetheinyl transferase family protein [Streptomyces sp. NPDC055794]
MYGQNRTPHGRYGTVPEWAGAVPGVFGRDPLPDRLPRRAELWLVTPRVPGPYGGTALLDAQERRTAAGLRKAADRGMYVAAHAALRVLAGAYLGVEAAAVSFTREDCPCCGAPHGRPALAPPSPPVHFSLSHAAHVALVAFAPTAVGADIEPVPPLSTVRDAACVLHPAEQGELSRLRGLERSAAFARCWTRKEAYVKGTGEGVAGPGFAATVVGTGERPRPVPGWTITDVRVPAPYAAACAVRDPVST